ncbi:response regulator [Roseomonas sp. BN140053]|uniref:response regulator n=1 Tax=Roseomonas sp. BN140053 TaxID=3391898 RepID=UPI0039EAD01C
MCDVLLVGRSELMRGVLSGLLERERLDVREAATPTEALALLEEAGGCRVLVTDIDLGVPGLNGFELVERMRQQVPHLPVVFVTGHCVAFETRSQRLTEVTLAKPVHPADLIGALRGFLQTSPRCPEITSRQPESASARS